MPSARASWAAAFADRLEAQLSQRDRRECGTLYACRCPYWEDSSINVQPSTLVRGGAVCGFLYTAVTIATTIYVETQTLPPTKSTLTTDQNDMILLNWVHQHASLMDVYMLSALAGFILLGAVAVGLFLMLRRTGARLPLIGMIMAFAGLGLSVVAAVLERVDYVHFSQQCQKCGVSNPSSAVMAVVKPVLKSFESSASRDYAIDTSGRFAVVFWIALVGVSLISLYSWRSAPVLGSFAAFFVGIIGFTPVFAVWSAGAGFGLWKLAEYGMPESPIRRDPPYRAPQPERTGGSWLSRRRPQQPEPLEVDAIDLDEEPSPSIVAVERAPEPVAVSQDVRPPRGTSVPRRMPGQAKGSKSSQPRRRR